MAALLTIVVPIYNVERYLAECLDSIRGQTHTDIEAVLVDDGSTDGSGAIAEAYAAADDRFRLVREPNRGLGAARNAGIDAGVGTYLTFVDGDDVLPRYALEVLVGALKRTGSEFASGNVFLMSSRGVRQSRLHRGTHRVTRLATNLGARRNLVYDRLACNKVFRRAFWDRHGLRFPESVRYEDIPVTVPAYALAGAVDVIGLPVYYWRQREAGSEQSITQRKGEVSNLEDRFAAVRAASRSLASLDPALKDWYDETALQSDLRMFLHLLPDVDDVYRKRFLDLAEGYLDGVDERVVDRLTPALRVAWRLARRQALPELLTVVAETRGRAELPVVRRGRRYFQQVPFLDAGLPDLPRSLYAVSRSLRAQVSELRWHAGRLRLTGYAYATDARASWPWSSVRGLWLREDGGSRRLIPLPSLPRRSPDVATDDAALAWAGFRVSVDPAALRSRSGWVPGSWTVMAVAVGSTGAARRGVGVGEISPPLPARWVGDDVRITMVVRNGVLRLVVERVLARLTGVRLSGAELELTGELSGAVAERVVAERVVAERDAASSLCRLRLSRVPGIAWRHYPVSYDGSAQRGMFTARIPLADLASASSVGSWRPGEVGDGWLIELEPAGGEGDSVPVAPAADLVDLRGAMDHGTVLVEPGDSGSLWIRSIPPGPLLTGVQERVGELVLDGLLSADAPPSPEAGFELVLRLRDEDSTVPSPGDVRLPVRRVAEGWHAPIPTEVVDGMTGGYWWILWAAPEAEAVDLPCSWRARERVSARWAGRIRLEPDRHGRVVLHRAD